MRAILIGIVLLGLGVVSACADAQSRPTGTPTWTIRISGDESVVVVPPGAARGNPSYPVRAGFKGSILVTRADGASEQRSIAGNVPTEYRERGNRVAVTVQKEMSDGELIVTVFRDDVQVNEQSTTAEYGVVSISASAN